MHRPGIIYEAVEYSNSPSSLFNPYTSSSLALNITQPLLRGSLDFFKGISQFGVIGVRFSNDKSQFLMHDIPKEMKGLAQGHREARLVFPGMARAFATFFDKRDGSPADIALMLSKICSVPGTYRYCHSAGLVQSAGDVAVFLQAGPLRTRTFVLSADDLYGMVSTSSTPADVDRGEVFLEYELAKTDYPYLSKPNDLKMGLLHVCKKYAIRLCCGEVVEGGIYRYMLGDRRQDEIPQEFSVWSPQEPI